MNLTFLEGSLGADPEVRSVGSGRCMNLRVATSESWNDRSTGERKTATEWHSVVVWDDAKIDAACDALSKGSPVVVCGKLQTRKWQDQSGNDRYSTEIVVKPFVGFIGLGFRPERQDDRQSNRTPARQSDRQPSRSGGGRGGYTSEQAAGDLDDEIPF